MSDPYVIGYLVLGAVTAAVSWWWFVFGPSDWDITDVDDASGIVALALLAGAAWPVMVLIATISTLGWLTMRVSR